MTCNMALMDISDLEPMANALPKLLKKGGMYVLSLNLVCSAVNGAG